MSSSRYGVSKVREMMRLTLLICSLLAAAMPALAQTPTVEDLLAKNLESRGGAERLRAITTRRVAGTVTVQVQMPPGAPQSSEPAPQTLQMPMQVLAKRPNLMLQEMKMQDRRVVTAFDGQQAWAINPMIGPSAQLLQGVQADLIRDQAQFDGPLAYAKQRGDKMEVLGKEAIEGSPAWKLAITHGDKITTVYLDEKTALGQFAKHPKPSPVAWRHSKIQNREVEDLGEKSLQARLPIIGETAFHALGCQQPG